MGAKSGAGDIWVYYTATGDWKIEGDSLVMTFPDDKIEVKIDDNAFYYSNIFNMDQTPIWLKMVSGTTIAKIGEKRNVM